jgi:putative ABC transport system substrate-binding protein
MRRSVMLAGLGVLAVPRAGRAQQVTKVWRIGSLANGTAESGRSLRDAFVQGMRELGLVEGRHFVIEHRYAEGKLDRLPALVADLLAAKVDLVYAPSGIAALAAKKSGTTLPIVFALAPDPVGQGFAQSLAHPGGNMTGLTSTHTELSAKRLELLREAFPSTRRVAVLYYRAGAPAGVTEQLAETEKAAKLLGLAVFAEESPGVDDFARAFAAIRAQHPDALVVIENPVFYNNRGRLIEHAAALRVPAIYNVVEYVQSGGLMCFGASYADLVRRAATYVARIMKGAAPGELPIERPIKLDLAFNLATARAQGLTIPPAVLARADLVVD